MPTTGTTTSSISSGTSIDLVDLTEIDPDAPGAERFGGKARGLARLTRAGLPVPRAFALAAGSALPDDWPPDLRAGFEERCARLLAFGPLAVRSSALEEDGPERSFAGLFETRLDVADLPGAFAAAAHCILSGGSERVRAYAGRREPLPVGVLVQQMVPARAAGVIFTRDPSGRDPALLIEAAAGCGADLAAGRREPETWRVYRAGDGRLEARRTPASTPDGRGEAEAVLTAGEACELAETAARVAQDWDADLDLEWAIPAGGGVAWLQARPMTAGARWAPPAVERSSPGADDGPVTVWSNWNVRETMPDPVTPFTWSLFRDCIIPMLTCDFQGMTARSLAYADAHALDRVDGRIYFNMNALLASPALGPGLPRLMGIVDRTAQEPTRALIAAGILRPRRLPGGRGARLQALARYAAVSLRRLPAMARPRRALADLAALGERLGARPPVEGLSDDELLRELFLPGSPEAGPVQHAAALASGVGILCLAGDWLYGPWPEARGRLTAGLADNPTTLISVDLDELAEAARPLARHFGPEVPDPLASLRASDDEEARGWLRRLDAFLARNGHRCPGEFELAEPRWADRPDRIAAMIGAALAEPPGERLVDRLARLRGERAAALAAARSQAPLWKRPLMRAAARALTASMPLREAPKHELMRAFLRVRQAAVELGRRLAGRGILATPEDVFFLEIPELGPLVRGDEAAAADRVAQRRREWEAWSRQPAPEFIRSDGVPVEDGADEGEGLTGTGVGGGRGEGTVVILAEPDPAMLPAGSVLVVRFADPGWTPLFPRLAGLVMEVGGSLCHAAVVARELGVPAVVGVRGATERLSPGERVVVDGDTGRIEVLAGAAPGE